MFIWSKQHILISQLAKYLRVCTLQRSGIMLMCLHMLKYVPDIISMLSSLMSLHRMHEQTADSRH
jgi:hypothetical protein